MSTTTLFISSTKGGSRLADVAAGVFRALGLSQSEERHSSNYPPEKHYFAGYAQNACIQIYDYDDDQVRDFPFAISVEGPKSWRHGVGTVETDPQRLARLLVAGGFRVFIPHGAWYEAGWDRDGEVYAA
jgi:hypothetical protein